MAADIRSLSLKLAFLGGDKDDVGGVVLYDADAISRSISRCVALSSSVYGVVYKNRADPS